MNKPYFEKIIVGIYDSCVNFSIKLGNNKNLYFDRSDIDKENTPKIINEILLNILVEGYMWNLEDFKTFLEKYFEFSNLIIVEDGSIYEYERKILN